MSVYRYVSFTAKTDVFVYKSACAVTVCLYVFHERLKSDESNMAAFRSETHVCNSW